MEAVLVFHILYCQINLLTSNAFISKIKWKWKWRKFIIEISGPHMNNQSTQLYSYDLLYWPLFSNGFNGLPVKYYNNTRENTCIVIQCIGDKEPSSHFPYKLFHQARFVVTTHENEHPRKCTWGITIICNNEHHRKLPRPMHNYVAQYADNNKKTPFYRSLVSKDIHWNLSECLPVEITWYHCRLI